VQESAELITWSNVIKVAVIPAIYIVLKSAAVALIKSPSNYLLGQHLVIQVLSSIVGRIAFFRHPLWDGEWEVTWKVRSSRNFGPENAD